MRTLKGQVCSEYVQFNSMGSFASLDSGSDIVDVPATPDGIVLLDDTPENRNLLENLGISYALS
jgi:hypothetical protein